MHPERNNPNRRSEGTKYVCVYGGHLPALGTNPNGAEESLSENCLQEKNLIYDLP